MKERGSLEAEMADVFGEEIKNLATELQEILIDDMVTAFESRIAVLCKVAVEEKGPLHEAF